MKAADLQSVGGEEVSINQPNTFTFPEKQPAEMKTKEILEMSQFDYSSFFIFGVLLSLLIIILAQTWSPEHIFMVLWILSSRTSIFTIIEAGSTFENMEIQDLRLK